MRWFDDVWMKEVFANFMAAKIVNPVVPGRQPRSAVPARLLPDGLRRRSHGRHQCDPAAARESERRRHALRRHHLPQGARSSCASSKRIVGADAFRDGLREYLKTYSFGNATWPDLIQLLGRRTLEDLVDLEPCVGRGARPPGHPSDGSSPNGAIARLTFTQRDPVSRRGSSGTSGSRWRSATRIVKTIRRPAERGPRDVPAARGVPASFVLPNGGGLAYGEIHLDPASLRG